MWSFLDVGGFRRRSCQSHEWCRRLPKGAPLSPARDLLPWSHGVIWVVPDGSAELGEMPQRFLDLDGIWVKSSFSSGDGRGGVELSRVLHELFLIWPPLQKPSADPLLLPLCVSHSCDPQSFSRKLKELEIGWVLLPLCPLLCSSGGKKLLPPFSLLQQCFVPLCEELGRNTSFKIKGAKFNSLIVLSKITNLFMLKVIPKF